MVRLTARAMATLIVAVASLLALAPAVDASLWVEFEPPEARPGDTVFARTIGRGAVSLAAGSSLEVWLEPAQGAASSKYLVGELEVDASGDGQFRFRVPELATGRYTAWVRCVPCAPSSGGREVLFVGELTVLDPLPATYTARPFAPALLVVAAVGASLVAAMVLAYQRRSVR